MILDRGCMGGTTVRGTSPALDGRESYTAVHEAGTSPRTGARRPSTQLWRVIRQSSRVRFEVARIAADSVRGWIRPAGGHLYIEDDRITAMSLLFDLRDAHPHLDEDGDTVGLVDQLGLAYGLRRSPIVRFHSTHVTTSARDSLIDGELVLFRSTLPITMPGRLSPAEPGSSVIAFSAAARISLEDLGFNSPLRAGAHWLATDPIEIVLDTIWSRHARTG